MSYPPRQIPSSRLHKPTGQAVVRLNNHDRYLGKHGSEASHESRPRCSGATVASAGTGGATPRTAPASGP